MILILKADLKHIPDKRGAYLDKILTRILPLDPFRVLLYVIQYVENSLTNVWSQYFLVARLVKFLSDSSPDGRYHA